MKAADKNGKLVTKMVGCSKQEFAEHDHDPADVLRRLSESCELQVRTGETEFKSGGIGYGGWGKLVVPINGRNVQFQISLSLTVVNSKYL